MTPGRVLFVAPVEPWCRENGSSVIIADLLEGLMATTGAEIAPVFVRPPPPGYERHAPAGDPGTLLDIPGLPRWRSVVGAALRGASPLRMRFDNRRVTAALTAQSDARSFRPDIVHVEHLPLVDIGLAVARHYGSALVYRAHNIESRLWARRLGRFPRALQAMVIRHMEREEADAIRLADLTLCISDGDLAWAQAVAPTARCELLPCSLMVERYDAVTTPADRGRQICFVGGLDWAPNEDGLRWFLHEVFPGIRRALPDARLAVLARGAAERPWLSEHPGVRILAPESRALEVFAASRVSLAPLFQGGGVRIKIPESLAVGCPVVATPIGAEGHDLPGLTTTAVPSEFGAACLMHLRAPPDPGSRVALRDAVESRHGAHLLAARLIDAWRGLRRVYTAP